MPYTGSMSTQNQSLLGRLFSFIWGFIVGLYKTIVILGFVISLVLLWAAFRGNKPVQVEDNIALVVAPTGQLVDQVDRDAGEQFFENLLDEAPAQTSVREITEAFTRAATDERIPFAVLKMDEMWGAGQAQLAEITAAVKVFQASGKKVVAYGPWFDQSSYYAAAAADEVVVDPLGGVAIEGFSYYGNFFKDGLDKLGVVINVFRVGEYKSAVEPFTRNDMSPESKEANQEWLGDLWREYNVAVASGRKLKDNAADEYVRGMADGLEKNQGDSAAYAKLAGLVTHVETLSDFRARMGEKVGMDDNHGSFRQIHFRNYLSALDSQIAKAEAPAPQGHIALVVVQGELADGDSDQGVAGGDTISELLDEARRDEGVDAVLLRVDSPGGSVWASEQIRRAVQNLQGYCRQAGRGQLRQRGGQRRLLGEHGCGPHLRPRQYHHRFDWHFRHDPHARSELRQARHPHRWCGHHVACRCAASGSPDLAGDGQHGDRLGRLLLGRGCRRLDSKGAGARRHGRRRAVRRHRRPDSMAPRPAGNAVPGDQTRCRARLAEPSREPKVQLVSRPVAIEPPR